MRDKILEEFDNKKIVINVKTRKEYDTLMKYFEDLGIVLDDECSATSINFFKYYKKRTCIEISYGCLLYASTSWYKKRGYKIISYQEFLDEIEGDNKMKNKIKVIDLLNLLIAGDEEKLPKKIKYLSDVFCLKLQAFKSNGITTLKKYDYVNANNHYLLDYIVCIDDLNRELEIIEEPILDEKEKEYLSYVIKPFRDKVENIFKSQVWCSTQFMEYIVIEWYGGGIEFPEFEKGTMYKNMQRDKEYTLEELGL